MTSAINYSAIATGFPVAGQDNDSQGFRSNFGAISAALSTAKDEITNLQSKAMLKSSLTAVETATNDLNGSTIADGKLQGMATVVGSAITDNTTLSFSNAGFYYSLFQDNTAKTIQLAGIPSFATEAEPAYCSIKIMMRAADGNTDNKLVTLSAGTKPITADSSSAWATQQSLTAVVVSLSGTTKKYKLIEAFTYDGGEHVYLRFLGEY
jgi:hypothetical protein